MPQLIWTPQALSDVQRVYRFLAGKDPDAARRAVQTIRNEVKILEKQAFVGRPVEGMEPEFREWPIPFGNSGYVVIYRCDIAKTVLLAIRHQREAGYL